MKLKKDAREKLLGSLKVDESNLDYDVKVEVYKKGLKTYETKKSIGFDSLISAIIKCIEEDKISSLPGFARQGNNIKLDTTIPYLEASRANEFYISEVVAFAAEGNSIYAYLKMQTSLGQSILESIAENQPPYWGSLNVLVDKEASASAKSFIVERIIGIDLTVAPAFTKLYSAQLK